MIVTNDEQAPSDISNSGTFSCRRVCKAKSSLARVARELFLRFQPFRVTRKAMCRSSGADASIFP